MNANDFAAARKFLADNPDPIVYALNWNRQHHTDAAPSLGDPGQPQRRYAHPFTADAAALRDSRIADVRKA